MAGSALPERQVLPEKVVEAPDQTGADRRKRLQVDTLARRRRRIRGIVQGADEFSFERVRTDLPEIDADLNPGQGLVTPNGATKSKGLAEIGFVLEPFQMNVQVLENARGYLALSGDSHKRRGDTAGKGGLLWWNVVDMENHLEKNQDSLIYDKSRY